MDVIPNARMHGLNGQKEVIETIIWGLQQLGCQATYAVNQYAKDAINIVFGSQVLPIEFLKQIPIDSVIYNCEQIRGLTRETIRDQGKFCADTFRVWDYSEANMESWQTITTKYSVQHVPVGFSPILERIIKPEIQDIDILIYGLTGQKRLTVFHALSQIGLSAVFISGMYGAARDDLIARSKIVLNITLDTFSKIFEIVRVSYLLANKKAVVAELDQDAFIEDDIRNAVRFSKLNDIVQTCDYLIQNYEERQALEQTGFEAIKKRDITKILKGPLLKLPHWNDS
jgi:hypothetical protein